ncbi:hypothetical protein LMG28140_01061 [Paraburkholderia metrosideri]|jgi:hypothetical protein|uniref:Uncharacterized protein n=1 Tax=Paraburkholderia metrosideri TaxID=580937 RepID=A0ABM8ND78_9BURK|nr:hypothetical protein LMG28140_01061 [Paraburkholderia metrosideri]
MAVAEVGFDRGSEAQGDDAQLTCVTDRMIRVYKD